MNRLFLFSCFILSGCEMIVDVDVPFEQPSLVVNALFSADSLWGTYISQTRHVFDTVYKQVDNAIVVVYENKIAVDTLVRKSTGYYRSEQKKPLNVNTYEIRVMAPTFETAIGESSAPIPAEISSASRGTIKYLDGQAYSEMRIKFQDDGGTENYYEISVQTANEYIDHSGNVQQHSGYHRLLPDGLVGEIDGDFDYKILLKDILFNGKETEVNFKALQGGLYGGRVTWYLKTISKDLYQYLVTLQRQQITGENPFSQPANVFSNIRNGKGIVAGYGLNTFAKNEPKPAITSVSPQQGSAGDHIFITGDNFLNEGFGPGVMFTADQYIVHSNVLRFSNTEIEIVIPSRARSGKLYVQTEGGIVVYEEFVISD
ncbi:MAG: DUF4249 family protein [Chryseolinea sp.]